MENKADNNKSTDANSSSSNDSSSELNQALERARRFEAMATDYEKQLERFKGIDPDEVKANKEALDRLMEENAKKGDDKDLEGYKAHLSEKFQKEYGSQLDELRNELKEKDSKLTKLLLTDTALKKAAPLFNDDALEYIEIKVNSECKLQDGEIVVIGKDGEPRQSKQDPRKLMTVDEYLSELAEQKPSLTRAKGKAGTDDGSDKRGGSKSVTMSTEQFLKLSKEERAKLSPEERRAHLQQIKI